MEYRASNGEIYSPRPEVVLSSCEYCDAKDTPMCAEIDGENDCLSHGIIWLKRGSAPAPAPAPQEKPLEPIKRAVRNYQSLHKAIEAAGGDATWLLSNNKVEEFLATMAKNGITIVATYTKD